MRRPALRSCTTLALALSACLLAGCDLHDKAWDTESTSDKSTPPAAADGDSAGKSSEVSVIVSVDGAIRCRANGAAVTPLSTDDIVRNSVPAGSHLLIVQNNARDSEACFAVATDLEMPGTSSEGQATLRHIGGNMIVETDGAARLTLFPRDSQEDIDECVRLAGDDDLEKLCARLDADPGLIEGRDTRRGETPLARAAEAASPAVVLALLQRRANTETADKSGRTPLQLAAERGRTAIVKLLLSHGADANARTADGKDARALAVAAGHSEVAALLSGPGEHAAPDGSSSVTSLDSPSAKPFPLSDNRVHGPFADGSSLQYRNRRLNVSRTAGAGGPRSLQFDLPNEKDAWIALQDTRFRVMVRSGRHARVWATYTAGTPETTP